MLHQISVILFASTLALTLNVQQRTSQCLSLAAGTFINNGSGSGIINATLIAAGDVNIDGVNNTVPFCRIFATERYAVNSSVLYEAWLPDPTDYNGRYLSVGTYVQISASSWGEHLLIITLDANISPHVQVMAAWQVTSTKMH